MPDHIYLAHHGIKGMKWGVRRYRNKDGSLTPAGKRQQAKRNATAQRLDARADKYRSYASEFKKAADTLDRDGINGKSKYMRRMNETDWTGVYDGGAQHQSDFKSAIKGLREASASAEKYERVYRKGAEHLRTNPELMDQSYGQVIKWLNNTYYKDAKKKAGEDIAEDWAFIIDDRWFDLYE